MNGKIVFAAKFSNCLDYVLNKQGARLLETYYLIGQTVEELTREFNFIASASDRIQKPVMHLSLSPHPDDRLTDKRKIDFCIELLEILGMDKCQRVIVEHNDTTTPDGKPRPHLHLVVNRIPMDDDKAVNSSWIRLKLQKALDSLRYAYSLAPLRNREEILEKAPTTGQIRRYRSELKDYQQKKRSLPPEIPAIVQFQQQIKSAATNSINMVDFLEKVKNSGIEPHVVFITDDRVKGITYKKDDHWFSGYQLGRGYTFNGLQKHYGIDYQPERDNELLKESPKLSFSNNTEKASQNNPGLQMLELQQAVSKQQKRQSKNKSRSQQLEL
jgi:Relaxase/Mobilisation nuclease domain